MRGADVFQESLFTTVQLESFVPADHPLRAVKALLDEAMFNMNWLFESIYCDTGRESIPPERLIRAQLLQVLYSCLLYTSPSPRDATLSRMPSSA